MRHFIAPAAAALILATAAAPAFAKGHLQPADPAQEMGQKVAHNSYFVSEDARGEEDGEKSVDGGEISADAPTNDRGAKTVAKPDSPGN